MKTVAAKTWLGVNCPACGCATPVLDAGRNMEDGDVIREGEATQLRHFATEGVRCGCGEDLAQGEVVACEAPRDAT